MAIGKFQGGTTTITPLALAVEPAHLGEQLIVVFAVAAMLAPVVLFVADGGVNEVILAVNATVEGQTTAHFIADQLAGLKVNVSRLAHGVPVGGELDYLDEGTLSAAIKSRRPF